MSADALAMPTISYSGSIREVEDLLADRGIGLLARTRHVLIYMIPSVLFRGSVISGSRHACRLRMRAVQNAPRDSLARRVRRLNKFMSRDNIPSKNKAPYSRNWTVGDACGRLIS